MSETLKEMFKGLEKKRKDAILRRTKRLKELLRKRWSRS